MNPVFAEKVTQSGGLLQIPLEVQLLLLCSRRRLLNEHRLRISIILSEPGLNCDHLLSTADEHGLLPLLTWHLTSGDFSLPEPMRTRLLSAFRESADESLRLSAEMLRVVRILGASGIRSLVYKGATLALLLYENIALRQFCDVDILISPSDLRDAKHALLNAGYEPLLRILPVHESAYYAANCELQFISPETGALVELQWRIVPHYFSVAIDIENLIARSIPARVGGVELQTLSCEDIALVMVIHGTKHAWCRLSWLCDFAELVRADIVDWSFVSDNARRVGVQKMLAAAAGLASTVLEVPLPPDLDRSLRNFPDAKLEATLRCNLFRDPPKLGNQEKEPLRYFLLQAELRERWVDRIRMFYRLLVTPSLQEWSGIRLPSLLYPLYKFVRLIRLLRKIPSGDPHIHKQSG